MINVEANVIKKPAHVINIGDVLIFRNGNETLVRQVIKLDGDIRVLDIQRGRLGISSKFESTDEIITYYVEDIGFEFVGIAKNPTLTISEVY